MCGRLAIFSQIWRCKSEQPVLHWWRFSLFIRRAHALQAGVYFNKIQCFCFDEQARGSFSRQAFGMTVSRESGRYVLPSESAGCLHNDAQQPTGPDTSRLGEPVCMTPEAYIVLNSAMSNDDDSVVARDQRDKSGDEDGDGEAFCAYQLLDSC
eukprot:6202516-Pleurochrysis_carterae.AAC.2